MKLTLSEAAAEVVRAAVQQASVEDPVVILGAQSVPRIVDPELARALIKKADGATIRALAIKDAASRPEHRLHLTIGIRSLRDCEPNSILRVGDLSFYFPPAAIASQLDWNLLLEESLVLKDSEGRIVLPPVQGRRA